MTVLLDASAVLAVLLDERGADEALEWLNGAHISAVNLSEVFRRMMDGGATVAEATEAVGRLRLETVPFDHAQAVEAARLRPLTRHIGASLADRACLGLASLEGWTILSADQKWALLDLGLDIRMIR